MGTTTTSLLSLCAGAQMLGSVFDKHTHTQSDSTVAFLLHSLAIVLIFGCVQQCLCVYRRNVCKYFFIFFIGILSTKRLKVLMAQSLQSCPESVCV